MKNLHGNEDIKKLPQETQIKLFDFVEKEIPKIPYFKPDGKPKKEWVGTPKPEKHKHVFKCECGAAKNTKKS